MEIPYTRPYSQYLRYSSIIGFILCFTLLAGCSTNFREGSASKAAPKTAAYHLKLANEASSVASALEHRLFAANLLIQTGKTEEAQRVLRETRNAEEVDASVHKSILAARLSLLHNDIKQAQSHLQSALSALSQYTHSNLANQLGQGTGHQHIALLLPAKGPHAKAAKTVRDGLLAAYYQTKQNQSSDNEVKIYDTQSPNVEAAYRKALAENASFIVGPLTKPEVQAIAKLPLEIPVLALNTISEDQSFPRNLYQFGLMPEDEVVAIGAHALRQGRSHALILAPQSEWGQRLADTFKHFWTSHNATVVGISFFKSPAELESKIRALLQINGTTKRTDADMIFIAASNELGRQIKPLLNLYHAEMLPVYATSSIYAGTPMPNRDHDLNGIHFCDMPWILRPSASMQETYSVLQKLWPNSVNESPRFFALGMDAYQLAIQLETKESTARNIAGFTGDLQINNYQRVQRGLVCARFENGAPVPD